MKTIAKSSMKMQAYDIIRDRILSQKYKSGETLNISVLCQELEISNTPVREALSLLEMEGLIQVAPNAKIKVIEVGEELIAQTCHSFFALISGAYSLCTFTGKTNKLIALLEKYLRGQEAAYASRSRTQFARKALLFDKAFVEATGNPTLLALYSKFESVLYLVTLHVHDSSDLSRLENLQQHRQILELVQKGDAAQVQEALMNHYSKVTI